MKFLGAAAIAAVMLSVPVEGAAQGPTPASGDFFITRRLDDFTDEDRTSITVPSDDGESVLLWGCGLGGELQVFLTTGYMGGENGEVDLMWRVDRNEPSPTIRGPQSPGKQAAFVPSHSVYSFTREAILGNTVVFQISDPLDNQAERHRYSLIGLTASLSLLSCYSPD